MDLEEWQRCNDFGRMLAYIAPSMTLRQFQLLACACCRFSIIWQRQLQEVGQVQIHAIEQHVDKRIEGQVGKIFWGGTDPRPKRDWLPGNIIGIELGIHAEQEGRSMVDALLPQLRGYVDSLAIEEVREREPFNWTLEELGATAWGNTRIEAGYQHFQAVDTMFHVDHEAIATEVESCWLRRWRQYVWAPELDELSSRLLREFDSHACHTVKDLLTDLILPTSIAAQWLAWNNGQIPALAEEIYNTRNFARMRQLGRMLENAGCSEQIILRHCQSGEPHYRGCWVLDRILGLG
jgi:hypothetical protein